MRIFWCKNSLDRAQLGSRQERERERERESWPLPLTQEPELERLTHALEAELKYIREQNELEIAKSRDLSSIVLCSYLSCCMSRQARLPSCSNPLYQLLPTADVSQFCPAAPQVAFSSTRGGNLSGKLESSNVYVAERLLMVSEELQPAVFYQRFQAGFAVTRRDPPPPTPTKSYSWD